MYYTRSGCGVWPGHSYLKDNNISDGSDCKTLSV